ncbi:MAG: glycerophosphodiester phosphodiesterase [Thermodesulfobacteriota bacterium]
MSRPDSSGGHRPWLIAHRGANAEAPENTMAAFDAALGHGVDGLEFDVQMTGDGVPVIFHDDTLKRMTGEKGAVSDYTAGELAACDAGACLSPDFRGTAIPTLTEVLSAYADRTVLMIELKAGTQEKKDAHSRRKIARQTVERIENEVKPTRRKYLFILSFDGDIIETARNLAPDLNCILNRKKPFAATKMISRQCRKLWGYGVPLHRLNRAFVCASHAAGQMIMTYSCNSAEEIDRAMAMGVDVLLTDDPARVGPYFYKAIDGQKTAGRLSREKGGRN